VANVVPDVGEIIVSSNSKSSHEAVKRHVILLSIETAQADVVVQLGIVHTHLQQPPGTEHMSSLLG